MTKIYKLMSTVVMMLCLYSAKMNAQPVVLVPASGSNTIVCGTNSTLQDEGGTGSYQPNDNGYTVIMAGFQAQITIAGTYDVEQNYDYIYIYSGVGTGGTLLQTYNNPPNGNINFTGAPGQTLTVRFISDGSVQYTGFNLNVTFNGPCFNIPCTGAPAANSVVTPTYGICPNTSVTLRPATVPQLSGITYTWQSSTANILGPYTTVYTTTNNSYPTPNITQSTYYQVLASCINGGTVTVFTAGQVTVQPITINTIPYYEGFEGVSPANNINNNLPNCSWASTGGNAQTNVGANTNGRYARTGNNFASVYGYNLNGTNYYYTNGLQMLTGITYSASMFYVTEYSGYTNFTEVSLKIGTTQAPATLTNIVTASPAVSPVYKELANTFTVPANGIYYVAIKVVSSANNQYANYLSWDDLSVTIPCQLNPTSLNITSPSSVICAGSPVNLTASGAGISTYTWSTGANTSSITDSPSNNITYVATGTSSLTNCSATTSKYIVVKPTPQVAIVPSATAVCEGSSIFLQALGAGSYTWSNGASGNLISYSTTTSGPISVLGSFSPNDNCTASASQMITFNAAPTINASTFPVTSTCLGQVITLTGSGAAHLQWVGSNGTVFMGSPIAVTPQVGAVTYSLTGTDENGCSKVATTSANVQSCTGINERAGSIEGLSVYPNPGNGEFTIELNNGLTKSIEVMDVTGRVLAVQTSSTDKTNVNINTFANGVYYVKVKTNNSVEVLKIVKQ